MIRVKEREGKQVIDVSCELITKVCDAINVLEPAMFVINEHFPKMFDEFQKNVCNLFRELHTAFLKADEPE